MRVSRRRFRRSSTSATSRSTGSGSRCGWRRRKRYDLRFVPDHEDTDASDYLPLFGWTLDGVSIDVQEHAYDSDFGYWTGRGAAYSQVQLSLDVSRERSPVLIDDFLGFVFAFMITSLTSSSPRPSWGCGSHEASEALSRRW